MSVSTQSTTIRPFKIPVAPRAELEALRKRIAATRWPVLPLRRLAGTGAVQRRATRGVPVTARKRLAGAPAEDAGVRGAAVFTFC
jgi:hypothetical protein